MFESASFWRVTSATATKMHRNAEMCHLAVSREGKRRGKVHKESCGERERERGQNGSNRGGGGGERVND